MASNWFLAKTDPGTYSAAQLAADKRTTWDGVTNPQAVSVIRTMRAGDKVWIYHSGGEPAVVAIAKVVSEAKPDPSNAKSAVVDLEYLRAVDPPVTLREIRDSGLFAHWALIRQGRLSTMAAPARFQEWMKAQRPKLKL